MCLLQYNWVNIIIFRSLSLNPITDHSYYKHGSCGLVDLVKTKERALRGL